MRVFYFYTATIGFALGIFVQSVFSVSPLAVVWGLGLSVVLALVWRRRSTAPATPLLLLSIFLLCFSLGMFRFLISEGLLEESAIPLVQLEGKNVTLVGEVTAEPDVRASTLSFSLTTESGGGVLVRTNRYEEVSYGDVVSVSGKVSSPDAFITDLGRTFNYPGYLAARGMTHTMSFATVDVVETEKGNAIVQVLLSFKQSLMESFQAVIPEPEAGLGAGLLLGVKQALGDDLESAFRKTGIIHIVVLSGYNVMIVAEAIMRLLSVVFSVRTRVVIGVIAIAAFALMVGLSATVVRASLMAILVLIARATGRTYAVMRALMFAGVVMLIINPYLLVFDPGFQLSFLATLGLVLVAPHIEKRLSLVPTKLQIREFLTATISTQLFVLPLLLYLIGEFSVVAVVVNVLVLPLVPLAMLLTFVTGLVGFLSTAAAIVPGFAAHVSLAYIVGVAERFAALPFAAYAIPPFPFWGVLVAYVAMGHWLWRQYVVRAGGTGMSAPGGWVVEEEEMVLERIKNGASPKGDAPSDTPVFFR